MTGTEEVEFCTSGRGSTRVTGTMVANRGQDSTPRMWHGRTAGRVPLDLL